MEGRSAQEGSWAEPSHSSKRTCSLTSERALFHELYVLIVGSILIPLFHIESNTKQREANNKKTMQLTLGRDLLASLILVVLKTEPGNVSNVFPMLCFRVCNFAVLMCGLWTSTQEITHSNTMFSPCATFQNYKENETNRTRVMGLVFLANWTFAARKR